MINSIKKQRAPRNKTVEILDNELSIYGEKLIKLSNSTVLENIENKTINQDIFEVLELLPSGFIDLLFVDPPYNLNKLFNSVSFREMELEDYEQWLDSWLKKMIRLLKPASSIYICGDWKSSVAIHNIAKKYFKIQNRITFEREKGRGAKLNWKNCSEDIWFCTMSDDYYFNVDAVKLRRRVLAPYRDKYGKPKDWEDNDKNKYRITYPSNIWTDITVPFWSMPENTEHPTQKPEKLLAKIILASSKPNDMIFDPFLGSGTTSVVAKKLGRKYCGVEIDEKYCILAEKRLSMAEIDKHIQGYSNSIFWERNSIYENTPNNNGKRRIECLDRTLFDRSNNYE